MSDINIQIKGYTRRFKTPFVTSRGIINERYGFIIRFQTLDGFVGYGEAGYDSREAAESLIQSLEIDDNLKDKLWGPYEDEGIPFALDGDDRLMMLSETERSSVDSAFQFAMDSAFYDFSSRIKKQPLSGCLRERKRSAIPVNYLISGPITDPEQTVEEIVSGGYRAVKVKVGVNHIEAEIGTLKMLRNMLGPEIAIRLDANRAWPYSQARYAMAKMIDFDIEYIEEPLDKLHMGRLSDLKDDYGIRIALDESLIGVRDIEKVLASGVIDTVVIKPAKYGIVRMFRLCDLASRHNCRLVITSNLETEIGIATQLHLAAVLPGELPPCGLDTMRLFENADQSLCTVVDGAIKVPEGYGIGFGNEIWQNL